MTDLRTMTIEGLCGRYRWGNPDGVLAELRRRDEATRKLVEAAGEFDAQRLALWPELLRQLDRASDLLSVCDLDAPSDVADMADIRQTLARARELR
jgi:hypothetical protein